MLFPNETNLKIKHACEQVRFNHAWWIEANCMLFIAWNPIGSKHASDHVQIYSKRVNWNKLETSVSQNWQF